MILELYYPVFPHQVNQVWGVSDPIYLQFGFKRHNGIDIGLVNGQEIRAPFDCEVVRTGNQPSGGGIYVGLLSKNKYKFPDGKECYVLVDFLHCKEIRINTGTIKVGDIVAYGDNTGVSTGHHTHMQCRRVNDEMIEVDTNDANNSFDQAPYWTGIYAKDYKETKEVIDVIPPIIHEIETISTPYPVSIEQKKSWLNILRDILVNLSNKLKGR